MRVGCDWNLIVVGETPIGVTILVILGPSLSYNLGVAWNAFFLLKAAYFQISQAEGQFKWAAPAVKLSAV
jgi:hypothetical protein